MKLRRCFEVNFFVLQKQTNCNAQNTADLFYSHRNKPVVLMDLEAFI